jgi:hypothetical protein
MGGRCKNGPQVSIDDIKLEHRRDKSSRDKLGSTGMHQMEMDHEDWVVGSSTAKSRPSAKGKAKQTVHIGEYFLDSLFS